MHLFLKRILFLSLFFSEILLLNGQILEEIPNPSGNHSFRFYREPIGDSTLYTVYKNNTLELFHYKISTPEELDSVFKLLRQFPQLQELSLKRMSLNRLPHSCLSLSSLTTLDLSDNTFENVEDVAIFLRSLPSLSSLHINLSTEEEVD